jgi:3-hydroxyisobutyrate dehydrogenase-like beta-hydroxyacid dehydrogenase
MRPLVAVIAPGAMGSGVGQRLTSHGVDVVTALAGRSQASVKRAQVANMRPVSDAEVADAEIILSIVPPGDALALAERLVPLLAGKRVVYVDCNAVNPETKQRIGAAIAKSGCPFVDVGIIGAPPKPEGAGPAFYAGGPHASRLGVLLQHGLDVRVIDGPIGAAAALKMSYAGITKGFTAIGAAMMLAATRAGAAQALHHELSLSQPTLLAWLTRQLPASYAKAYRWVAEMEEISDFVSAQPSASEMYAAIAHLYQDLAGDYDGTKEKTGALTAFLGGGAKAAAE